MPTSFIDKESDETIKQKPAFGVAGWTKDDAAVLLYDKFDVWKVPADGSKAQRLTDGAPIRCAIATCASARTRTGSISAKPVYVSLFGVWSKKSGYGQLSYGPTRPAARIKSPASSGSTRASAVWRRRKSADVYQYIAQDYDDSPDLFVGGADLKDAKQVTTTNAFQTNYAWGRSELGRLHDRQGA